MLHELKALIGSTVTASDGETGSIRTFFFDDQSWKVSYLVVDVGGWLKRRDVLLPVAALDEPNWANKTCSTQLTRKQIHDSPVVETEKPVSRQQEIAMREYWGALACWVNSEVFLSSVPAGAKYSVSTVEDSHLRSTAHMLGYQVWATDGDFGILEGFVMDETSWHLGYLDVRSGAWLQNRSVLVPTRWVQSVSWADFRVNLHHTKTGV